MPYLIDGHNLIGKIPSLNLDDLDDEKELIQLLQRYCQETGKDAEVYFDHSAMARHLKRLGNAAANWTVVSSDREVLASAKRSRARILSSEDFSQELIAESTSAGSADSPTISEDEIDDWLKLFGDGNSTES